MHPTEATTTSSYNHHPACITERCDENPNLHDTHDAIVHNKSKSFLHGGWQLPHWRPVPNEFPVCRQCHHTHTHTQTNKLFSTYLSMDGRDSMGPRSPPELRWLLPDPMRDAMLMSLTIDGRLSDPEFRGPMLGRCNPVNEPLRHSISTSIILFSSGLSEVPIPMEARA